MERGQTPFTPAVGILRQINKRLKEIDAAGGADAEVARVASQAADFRGKIKELPFELVSESPAKDTKDDCFVNTTGFDCYYCFLGNSVYQWIELT